MNKSFIIADVHKVRQAAKIMKSCIIHDRMEMLKKEAFHRSVKKPLFGKTPEWSKTRYFCEIKKLWNNEDCLAYWRYNDEDKLYKAKQLIKAADISKTRNMFLSVKDAELLHDYWLGDS